MIPLIRNTFLHEEETRRALVQFILRAKTLSMGEQCFAFEKAFAVKHDRVHGVMFNSGGSANLALLQALKNMGHLKEGDKIGFSAITWSTNVMPIIQMGFVPVAIDCSINTLNVGSNELAKTLQETHIRALFITNALGFTSDIREVAGLCRLYGIMFLEDNCEALGAETIYGKTGCMGLASTFSFFVAHHMSTIEGGMVLTDDEDLAIMLRIVRANGWDRNLTPSQQKTIRAKYKIKNEFESKYTFYDLGFNLRPTEVSGFLGQFQLQFLDEAVELRAKNYLDIESAMANNDDLILINRTYMSKLSPFAIPVICKNSKLRDQYLLRFFEAGIEVRPMIAGNIQKQPFYKKYVKTCADLANATFLHENSFYCGNYPEMTKDDLDTIKNALL